MKPLNRPMFKMGGAVKEGIMDGIREPRQNYLVGGAVTTFLGNVAARSAPLLARARGLFGTNVARTTNVPKLGPPTAGTPGVTQFSKGFPGPRLPGTPGVGPGSAQITSQVFQPNRLSKFFTNDPILGLVLNPTAGGFIKKTAQKVLKGALTTPSGLFTTGYLAKGFLGDGDPEVDPNVGQKGSTVGQRGKTPDTINQGTEKGNQFNDDGSKKETSVSRLLKAVEKRSRDAAVADSLIAAGEEIRTGGIDSDTVGNITQRVSKEFDKDVDLRQKLDLARIESELKKEQIAAQAIATDPVNIEIRKRKLTTIGDLDRADRGGVRYGVKGGIRLLAQDFEQLTGIQFQGSLGGDDELKRIADTEAFKLNPESVIKDSIENIKTSDGNIIVGENGTYMLGNQLYEYTNGVVKRLK